MKQLYMADLDGTLLPKGDKLSPDVVNTLNALIKRGLPFTLNTSRTPRSVAPVIADLKLKLPIILMNGSCVYDTNSGEISLLRTIDSKTASNVISICKSSGLNPFLFSYKDGDVSVSYTSAKTDAEKKFIEARLGYYPSFKKTTDYNITIHTPYIICVGAKLLLEKLEQRLKRISAISCSLFISSNEDYCFLEIYSSCAGKANGAKNFMNEYGFDRLIAFGDNLNDIDMLKFADCGIAVENAFDEAKAVADMVIGSCESGAVSNWLTVEWSRKPEMY